MKIKDYPILIWKMNYKYTIISTDKDYNQLIEKNKNLRKIHEAIFSKKL